MTKTTPPAAIAAAPISTPSADSLIARTRNRGADDLRVSFEFFPPKTDKMQTALWDAIQTLEPLGPDFVSVTYGAGGSTRERTHQTVARIAAETSLPAAAHLTCVGAPRDEIDEIAKAYWQAGVRHIVALRGDPQDGIGGAYAPRDDGYAYGADLVEGLKRTANFEISVGAYPEKHPESQNWAAEIDNLKRKVDAGATRAITQFFFTADTFLRYQDKVAAAGINIPVIPGLMLQPNFKGLKRMSKMCGVDVPVWHEDLFDGLDDDADTRLLLTASTAIELASELRAAGVRHFHFYTLNKANLAYSVCKVLGVGARRSAVMAAQES